MKKIFVVMMLLLTISVSFAEEEHVIYGPDDVVYNEYLKIEEPFMRLCVSGESKTYESLTAGVVESVEFCFQPNFYTYYGFDSYDEGITSLVKNGISKKYVTENITIRLNDKETLSYVGFEAESVLVEVGDEVEVGTTLGTIGYGVKSVGEKNLLIEYVKSGKLRSMNELYKTREEKVIEEVLTITEQQELYRIFRQTLLSLHPNLNAYVTKKELNEKFEILEDELNEPLTKRQLFLSLNRVVRRIRDNHTYIKKTFPLEYDLPVKIGYIEGDWYILDVYVACDIEVGETVESINGVKMNDMYNMLIDGAGQCDGYNFGFDHMYLLKESEALVSGFKYLYDIYYEPKMGDDFNIVTNKHEASLKLGDYDIEKAGKPFKYLEISEYPSTTHVRINTMSLNESYLKEIEDALKGSKDNILIDLRSNFGGEAMYVAEVFKFITDKPFRVDSKYEVRQKGACYALKHTTNLTTLNIFDHYVYDKETSLYKIDKNSHPELFSIHEGMNLCKGKNIYVLTSEVTGSAASQLASLIQNNGGTVLGREGAGNPYQMCGLKYANVRLHDTDMYLQIPLIRTTQDSGNLSDRGVVPDYHIPLTLEEVLHKKDTTLSEALKYIDTLHIK